MAGIGRANEVVVRDIDGVDQGAPGTLDEAVCPLLGADAVRGRGAQNLLAVLIGTSEKPGVVARLAVPAREHIGRDLGVGVPDVRGVVHVEDRGGDEERLVRYVRSVLVARQALGHDLYSILR